MRVFCSMDRPMTVTWRPKRLGRIEDLLDARDVGGEGGHDDPAVEALHDVPEGLADGALRGRVAGILGPRRIRHQAEHTLLAEAGQVVEVGELAVDRGVIELEVAGVDDISEGRPDAQAHGIGDGVTDAEGPDVEVPQLDGVPRLQRQERVVAELVLLELVAQQSACQRGGVDRHARELGQDVGQSADVVLVGMGDDEGLDALTLVTQVGDVGHDQVDAVHLLLGEHQPAVDDDDLVGELEHGHVLADLADAAEGDDPQDLGRCRGRALDCHLEEPQLVVGGVHVHVLCRVVPGRGSGRSLGRGRRRGLSHGTLVGQGVERPAVPAGASTDERLRDAGHVSLHGLLEGGLPQGRRRVVHGVPGRGASAAGRVERPCRAVHTADDVPGHECLQAKSTQRHHQGRVEDLELAAQERPAGAHLVGLRIAVAGRAALHDVGDEDILAPPTQRCQQFLEPGAGGAHEGAALAVLVLARALPHQDDLGVRPPSPGTACVRRCESRHRSQTRTSLAMASRAALRSSLVTRPRRRAVMRARASRCG